MPEPRPSEPATPEPAQEASVPALRPTPFMHVARTERPPIDPDLPADTPLEPGSAGRGRSPAERIAASEAALAPLKRERAAEVTGKANFIAAARRAAQAAANEGNPVEGPREERASEDTPTSLIGRFLANRRRALMVGVSLLLVLYGAIQVAGMFGSDRGAERPAPTSSQARPAEPRKMAEPAAPAPAPAAAPEPAAAPSRQSASEPPLIAPTPTPNLIAPVPFRRGYRLRFQRPTTSPHP